MIYLTQLSPAPWTWRPCNVNDRTNTIEAREKPYSGNQRLSGPDHRVFDIDTGEWEDLAFIALARNAFDVMLRRQWWVVPTANGQWVIRTERSLDMPLAFYAESHAGYFADPFTALVSADKWLKEQEAQK